MTEMVTDVMRMVDALKGVEIIDLVSFGSSISPEYLLTLMSHAPLGRARFGFIGASLPGNGWHGGLNSVIAANRVDWILGGFFATVKAAGLQLDAKRISVVNFPQGILAKLLTDPERMVSSRIGTDTFIAPNARCGVAGIHKPSLNWLGELATDGTVAGLISYSLPASQAVFMRGAGMTACGRVVPETAPIDLDVSLVAESARRRNARRVFQVPAGRILEATEATIELVESDFVFHAPQRLHSHLFFPEKYLDAPVTCHSRNGGIVDELAKLVEQRTLEKERLIVGIGYPVAISQKLHETLDVQVNVESGNIGGSPLDGSGFGYNVAATARISQLQMFERIWSGDIDHALLGVGEIDQAGAINIARLGSNLNGVGGFVDIAQSLKKITFCSPTKTKTTSLHDWTCYRPDSISDHRWVQV